MSRRGDIVRECYVRSVESQPSQPSQLRKGSPMAARSPLQGGTEPTERPVGAMPGPTEPTEPRARGLIDRMLLFVMSTLTRTRVVVYVDLDAYTRPVWKPRPFRQLDELERVTAAIERRTRQMSSDIHALDEALTKLGEDVAAIKTAVEALIAAIPSGDLTSEIAAVQDAIASIEATTAEAAGATPPPPG